VWIHPDGQRAYVSHLTHGALTVIDLAALDARTIGLPAAPLRIDAATADTGERHEAATLGYALAAAPDGARLFAARQALGAGGVRAWAGQAIVDVLLTSDDVPLAEPARAASASLRVASPWAGASPFERTGPGPAQPEPPFVQPRALVYRETARTLVVASEGSDSLVELDARAIDPSAAVRRRYLLAAVRDVNWDSATDKLNEGCGAPSGIALSDDEATAFVYCRSTDRVAAIALDSAPSADGTATREELRFSPDADPDSDAAVGRRLFYAAWDPMMTGNLRPVFSEGPSAVNGMACAACHPEGRDDGHTWHETRRDGLVAFETPFMQARIRGKPRQTPMLAGRVAAAGPYGWNGHSPSLEHRILSGFELHAWRRDEGTLPYGGKGSRARALAAFLREGLVPPRRRTPLAAHEERGRELFARDDVGCAGCHGGPELSDRRVVRLGPSTHRVSSAFTANDEWLDPVAPLRRRHGALLPRRRRREPGCAGRRQPRPHGRHPAALCGRPRRVGRVSRDPVSRIWNSYPHGPSAGWPGSRWPPCRPRCTSRMVRGGAWSVNRGAASSSARGRRRRPKASAPNRR
jgi:hypothetical protein